MTVKAVSVCAWIYASQVFPQVLASIVMHIGMICTEPRALQCSLRFHDSSIDTFLQMYF